MTSESEDQTATVECDAGALKALIIHHCDAIKYWLSLPSFGAGAANAIDRHAGDIQALSRDMEDVLGPRRHSSVDDDIAF